MKHAPTAADAPGPSGMQSLHACTRGWFEDSFSGPTGIQRAAWPVLSAGRSGLLLAPTGSGKTLAAFLAAIDRLMFPPAGGAGPDTPPAKGVRVLYISPLKALAVDIDRNLRAPLAGIHAAADRSATPHRLPRVAVRSGDTSAAERREIQRDPPDILITTPESLYLMLTSKSREALATVDSVIIDEIHAVAATKRGVHLFLSLERLERLRRGARPDAAPLQRIGLSATQRPLEEIARLLGGADATADPDLPPRPRPVEIIDASEPKRLELTVEVPVDDMANLSRPQDVTPGPTSGPSAPPSIWPAIHPRLVELIRGHRSTMIFVNSRRLAERLAAAINELAEEEIALAHHGSIAHAQRVAIEDRLKRGQLPAIVATSSLELGIDMGAVDLVVQIEAPPSVASGMQRIGRAGHHIGAPSKGVIFPKFRGDLLACAAATLRMRSGLVETTRYPRNTLDVLAQQMVAIAAMEPLGVDDLYAMVRGAAPFAELPRALFDGVLDLLAGRYPSDEFSELRPRLNWDRLAGTVGPRKTSQRIAVLNAGAIPDRGLYGVFLAAEPGAVGLRVGELDEEMVFETRAGEVFLLGASSWRVLEITRDRVIVTPAPGEPGKMPFWRGDGPGRPLDFGRVVGELTRKLAGAGREETVRALRDEAGLDDRAVSNLLQYIDEQTAAAGEPPTDKTIVVETFLDEIGDWRVVVLSPFGARVHAPWALAIAQRLREQSGLELDLMWSDDGIVLRLPESEPLPGVDALLMGAGEVEDLVVRHLGSTALFASHFRENAARALLLPRRQPGRRTPLWLQRRKSADLLAVASRYERFPILLETYRECLRDVFDVPGLKQLLGEIARQQVRVHAVETDSPSPFAASLMFNYTANFLYEGDAPLAERRAQSLALDHAQLRELLGAADYRELLDADAIDEVALGLQRLDERRVGDADAVHDLLLYLGDLSEHELMQRVQPDAAAAGLATGWVEGLLRARRIIRVRIAGEPRLAAAEDAARLRDALGVQPPPGLPEAFLETGAAPLADLLSRYARTRGPFTAADAAARFGLGEATARGVLETLAAAGRVLRGEFLPGGVGEEWVDAGVLKRIKRLSLARLRKQVEPVAPEVLARFLPVWQGLDKPRRGLDGLLDAVEQLQGAPLAASALERDILPARVVDYLPGQLDELCAAGEVVWRGVEASGPSDGRIALYLADSFPLLAPPATAEEGAAEAAIITALRERGAQFFDELLRSVGGFKHDMIDSLWRLVWSGAVTNDTLAPMRSRLRVSKPASATRSRVRGGRDPRVRFRSRRTSALAGSEGRWSLLPGAEAEALSPTVRQTALVEQLLRRYGVVTRGVVGRETVVGGFGALYPVLRAMEEAGKVRRGYFVEGMGGAQFALPGSEDLLRRDPRIAPDAAIEERVLALSAADPACAYGSLLKWPATRDPAAQLQRTAGAAVLIDAASGQMLAYLARSTRRLATVPSEGGATADDSGDLLAQRLAKLAEATGPLLLDRIDGAPIGESPLCDALRRAGFVSTSRGYLHRGVGRMTRLDVMASRRDPAELDGDLERETE
ncbi:Lhr family helicase [Pirellulimonas nuda]|uniref:Lhr family helicase n=1 Tax=Pirellulimonas nuda TaxID=2528009 RepID=UPI0018D32D52|nr:DEAD/DEAH box helicase [Pirellulimonas nuda]